jgi:hypothetical protein
MTVLSNKHAPMDERICFMSGFSRLLIAGITAALFLLVMYACMDTSAPAEGADAILFLLDQPAGLFPTG